MDVYGIRTYTFVFIYLFIASVYRTNHRRQSYVYMRADLRETVRPIFIMSFTIDGSVQNNIYCYYIYTCYIPSVSSDYAQTYV